MALGEMDLVIQHGEVVTSSGVKKLAIGILRTPDCFKTYGLNAELIFISGAAPGMQAMAAFELGGCRRYIAGKV